jgi:hypothetical protein
MGRRFGDTFEPSGLYCGYYAAIDIDGWAEGKE